MQRWIWMMKVAVPLLVWAGSSAAQPARADIGALKRGAGLQALDLRQVHDARLQGLLDVLVSEGVVTATAQSAWHSDDADTSVIIVPLARLTAPDTLLHLFYLPDAGAYLFMQLGRGPDGREELRLWGAGRSEMLVSADEVVLLPAPSTRTFRLPEESERRLGFERATSDLTVDEILGCLGRTLGVVWNPTTLASLLGSAVCTATNVFAFAQTACNCLSMFGIGANNVYAPLGCFTGMGHLLACGLARCTPLSQPPPSGPPSSCGVESIAFNQSTSGSWSAGCQATHRSGRYARYYAFDLASGGSVRINLRSSADAYLILLRGRGTGGSVVAEDDDTFLSTDAEIAMSLPAGSYTIEATTYSAGVTGSFTLSLAR